MKLSEIEEHPGIVGSIVFTAILIAFIVGTVLLIHSENASVSLRDHSIYSAYKKSHQGSEALSYDEFISTWNSLRYDKQCEILEKIIKY